MKMAIVVLVMCVVGGCGLLMPPTNTNDIEREMKKQTELILRIALALESIDVKVNSVGIK